MLTFIFDAVRALLSLIDKVVYWFLSELIALFDAIASIRLFSDDVIKEFSSRIFIFISIIMIFKVSFSIIQYIINPDNFTDKEKGFSKVIQNVLITLVCLVFVGKVFEIAYDVQKRVLDEHVIPSIILGIEDVDSSKQGQVKDQLPFLVVSAFFTPNVELSEIEYNRSENVYACNGTPMYTGSNYNSGFGSCMDTISEDAFDVNKYNTSITTNNYWNLLDNATIKKRDNADVYVFDYKFIISTAAGIFMVIIYINFCIDLAIRAAKLGFLQLIAPIPIISMIDPKSSKSGMMSKWIKQCASTYAGLFIRVAAVNFVIYIIYIIMNPEFFANLQGQSQNIFVQILIIFGALMFAKDLPKMITDLTGVDLKGDFKLNPFKRVPNEISAPINKVGSTLGAAALGGAVGLVSGVGSKIGLARQNYAGQGIGGFAKGFGSTLKGAAGGVLRGAGGGLVGGFKDGKMKNVIKTGSAAGKKVGEQNYKFDGTNIVGRTASRIQQGMGWRTAATRYEEDIKGYEEYAKIFDEMKSQADNNKFGIDMNRDLSISDADITAVGLDANTVKNIAKDGTKGLREYYEALQNSGTATVDQVRFAKNAYEAAQAFIIDHAHDPAYQSANTNGEQIAALKAYAGNYAQKHGYLNGEMTHSDSAGFNDYKLGQINARKKISGIKYGPSSDYDKSKRTDEAVKK